jgi:hypothetical protein
MVDSDGNRVDLIHPNHVLISLKVFLEEYRGHQKFVYFFVFENNSIQF